MDPVHSAPETTSRHARSTQRRRTRTECAVPEAIIIYLAVKFARLATRIVEGKSLVYLGIQNGTYVEPLLTHSVHLLDSRKNLLLQPHAKLRVLQLSVHEATVYYH